MNILIGSSSPLNLGSGIRTYVETISQELKTREHQLFYACPSAENMLKDANITKEQHLEISQHQTPQQAIELLLNFIIKNNVDFIINNDNPFVAMAAPLLPCPIISIGHLATTSVATLTCYQHQWVDHIVAISEDMKATFINKYKVPPSKVNIIYNGVESQPYVKNTTYNNKLHVTFAGGTNTRKGGDKVLHAVLNQKDQWQGIHLHWFGKIEDTHREKLDNIDFITIYGNVPRSIFVEKLSSSDVLLLPSLSEGCPMVMLEAMSHGVIPIASDGKGAMSRLVTHGEEGFICSLAEWDKQMFSCLHYLLSNPPVINTMSKAVQKRQQTDFTIQHVVDRLEYLGRSPIVNRNNPPSSIALLKWHRPFTRHGKAPLLDRIYIKAGALRKAGVYTMDNIPRINK